MDQQQISDQLDKARVSVGNLMEFVDAWDDDYQKISESHLNTLAEAAAGIGANWQITCLADMIGVGDSPQIRKLMGVIGMGDIKDTAHLMTFEALIAAFQMGRASVITE